MSDYEKEMAARLVDELVTEGFTVYLAERGTYGFYTDDKAERAVGFEFNLGVLTWHGKYSSKKSGCAWGIEWSEYKDYHSMLYAWPPRWAVKGDTWTFVTVQQNLDRYDELCQYTRYDPVTPA